MILLFREPKERLRRMETLGENIFWSLGFEELKFMRILGNEFFEDLIGKPWRTAFWQGYEGLRGHKCCLLRSGWVSVIQFDILRFLRQRGHFRGLWGQLHFSIIFSKVVFIFWIQWNWDLKYGFFKKTAHNWETETSNNLWFVELFFSLADS